MRVVQLAMINGVAGGVAQERAAHLWARAGVLDLGDAEAVFSGGSDLVDCGLAAQFGYVEEAVALGRVGSAAELATAEWVLQECGYKPPLGGAESFRWVGAVIADQGVWERNPRMAEGPLSGSVVTDRPEAMSEGLEVLSRGWNGQVSVVDTAGWLSGSSADAPAREALIGTGPPDDFAIPDRALVSDGAVVPAVTRAFPAAPALADLGPPKAPAPQSQGRKASGGTPGEFRGPRPFKQQDMAERTWELLVAIRDAPVNASQGAIVHAWHITPQAFNSLLNRRRPRPGLAASTTSAQFLAYFRANLEKDPERTTGKSLAQLIPRKADPTVLTEFDKQVIGTVLRQSDQSVRGIALRIQHPTTNVHYWLAALGARLGVTGTGAEVAVYVQTHAQEVLALAGISPDNPPHLPHRNSTVYTREQTPLPMPVVPSR
ncbi:hypothetical protein AB0D66_32530 [Streptomyces sp. NPDC048270]|uniref:hypothetical protein n=1 Tax=Streptomyces sp. NPDC048270 TaxID=3154615 RepID=UPI0034025FE6